MKSTSQPPNRLPMYVTLLIIFLLAAVSCFGFYTRQMDERVTAKVHDTLRSSVWHDMQTTDIIIESQFRVLEMYAELYANQPGGAQKYLWQIIGQMESVRRASDFDTVGMALADGLAFTSDKVFRNVRDEAYYTAAIMGRRAMTQAGFAGDAETYYVLAVPVVSGEEVIGVAFGLCRGAAIRAAIAPDVFGEFGGTFLYGSDGNLLLSVHGPVLTAHDAAMHNLPIFLNQAVFTKKDAAQAISDDIDTGAGGVFACTIGNESCYGAYQPSAQDGRVLVALASRRYITREIARSSGDVWLLLLVVLLFSLAAATFVMLVGRYSQRQLEAGQKKLLLIEEQARLQEEKLKFALGRSSTRVWEYDIRNDRIASDTHSRLAAFQNNPENMVARQLVHPDDISKYLALHEAIMNGEPYAATEVRLQDGDGGYFWNRIEYTTIFDDDNKPMLAVGVANDISAQKMAEKRYLDELAYRQAAAADSLITFCVNCTTGRVEDAISYDKRMDWLTSITYFDDLMDRVAEYIVNEADRERVKKETRVSSMVARFESGVNSDNIEYRRDLGMGEIRWLCLSMNLVKSPANDDVMAFVYTRDITDQKMLEMLSSSAVLSDYEYVASLDVKTDFIYAVRISKDVNAKPVTEAESFSQRLLRLSQGELRMTPEQMESLSTPAIRETLEYTDSYSIFFEVPDDEGRTVRKKIHYTYLDREKGLVLLTRTDVTDVYNEEQRKNALLSQALKTAENASRARGDFLAHMSHEIRTPLNGIRGMLDIIKENPDENLKLYLDKVIISAKHLTGLINDILDMSRIDSGKLELVGEWLSTEEFMTYIEAIIAPQAQEKGISYIARYDWQGCTAVFTDGNRLKQICINLLSNAVKYTNSGGRVTFDITVTPLEGETISLSVGVEDNGIGMSREFLADAFEPFSQADKSFAKKGTGLGLTITKRLVELMNSSLRIKSTPGAGTSVGFTLELLGSRAKAQKSAGAQGQAPVYEGRRALVADDHKINRIIAEKQLNALGIMVDTAADGAEALARFAQAETGYYDIIFMDIMMPVLDGLEATRALRALERADAQTIKIVAMTANAFAEDIYRSFENGMDYHLSKPFDRSQLIDILAQVFGGMTVG